MKFLYLPMELSMHSEIPNSYKVKHFIIGTAGHIDHGKTSLVKALTQIDCDTHQEEKKRGITINLGFAHLLLPDGTQAGIIDVPGHKDFIHTMISGASGIDLLLLVIAADEGIMPQTLEHIEICRQLGIKKAIVALSKTDLCDPEWIDLISEEISQVMEINNYPNVPIIPCSVISGSGLHQLTETILEAALTLETRNSKGPFRMYIDRIFNLKGQGFVATGSVMSGKLTQDQRLLLLPGGQPFGTRGLQRFGQSVNEIQAGDRAAINIIGFKIEEFEKGMLFCSQSMEPSLRIDAAIEISSAVKKLKKRSTVLLLSGTFVSQATMYLINQKEAIGTDSCIAQFHLEKPGIFMPEDRFIIRNTSGDQTLGGGFIMDPFPLHHKRPGPSTIQALETLKQSFLEKGKSFLRFKIQLEKDQIPCRINTQISPTAAKAIQPVDSGIVNMGVGSGIDPSFDYEFITQILTEVEDRNPEEDGMLWDPETRIIAPQIWVYKHTNTIHAALAEYHYKNYLLDTGLSIAEIAGKCGIKQKTIEWESLNLLLKKLIKDQKIKAKGNQYQLNGFEPRMDSKDKSNLQSLEEVFLSYGANKPLLEEVEEFARSRSINKEKLIHYLAYLVQERVLYTIDKEYLHRSIVDQTRKLLLDELKRKGKGINEGEFRVLFNGTKKIVHPLIAIFEKEGIIKQEIYIINITELGLSS